MISLETHNHSRNKYVDIADHFLTQLSMQAGAVLSLP